MNERRCGYCRDYGHTVAKCATKRNLRRAIGYHTLNESMAISQALSGAGFGPGAIIKREGDDSLYLIENHNFLNGRNDYYDERNVKYSKQVRITLHSFTGKVHTPPECSLITTMNRRAFVAIVATDMTNMSEESYFQIMAKQAGINDIESSSFYSWYNRCELVAPSYDPCENSNHDRAIFLPQRLRSSGEGRMMKPSEIISSP